MNALPRPEYPRPQLRRDRWLTLNGRWQFEIDAADTGIERGVLERELGGSILVPFAPESTASGIGHVDFMDAVWYRRVVGIPANWAGSDVLLHFGAVDHDATVWANGVEVARHRGGFTSFTADLTDVAVPGNDVTIVVRARDTRNEPQARGKQATEYGNSACYYTRTTGIWQSVWLEPVASSRIRRLRITPQLAGHRFDVVVPLHGTRPGLTLSIELRDASGLVAESSVRADLDLSPALTLVVPEDRVRPWSLSDPHLYDIVATLRDNETVVDRVESYGGLRSVSIQGNRILLNGEPVFQRLVLDQGLWPETLMTAPTDEALVRDIQLGMDAGFNGARLHQKVFEERYYYHADRMGYLVWGEFGDWGAIDRSASFSHNQQPSASFITQWVEALERDYNHPSIIGWCPLNETYQTLGDRITQLDDVTAGMYLATKLADPTRPVVDASGYSHRVRGADVYDGHDYEQDPQLFAINHAGTGQGQPYTNVHPAAGVVSIAYAGQPYFVSEYGGIWWNPQIAREGHGAHDAGRVGSWGYGQRVASAKAWIERFTGLTNVLLDDPNMFGYCFTQLTDTFQEENGIYTADRREKFATAEIAAVQRRVAAYEQG